MRNLKTLMDVKPFSAGCPRYIQLADRLEEAIQRKLFTTGFIPPEREIAKQLHISRVTVNSALKVLEEKNLIIRKQGVGTRIARRIGYSFSKRQSFMEKALLQGDVMSNQWLLRDKRKIDQRIAQYIELPAETVTAYLKRVRLINGCPIRIESTYIPLKFLPEPSKLENSLYAYWDKQGFCLVRKHYYLRAIGADREISVLLNVSENTPILKAIEITRNENDEIMEVSETFVLSDYYEYEFDS